MVGNSGHNSDIGANKRLISHTGWNTLAKAARTSLGLMLLVLVLASCLDSMKTSPYPPVLYIGWDDNSRSQIFRLEAEGTPSQLTDLESEIIDFAVSPDATQVALTTMESNGMSTIWRMHVDGDQLSQILECSEAECSQPVWAPDGRRLIYERRTIGQDGLPSSAYMWWLDTETGETASVLDNNEIRGMAARFSPEGEWLSYAIAQDEGTYIYNRNDGRSHFVPEGIGVPVAWSPTSEVVLVPNLDLVIVHGDEGEDHLEHTHDYQTAVHLFALDLESGDLEPISEDLNVDDSVPAWSPGADWIAFGRRLAGPSTGRQLWLMRPDGSEARALTEDFSLNHGPPIWSPDGRYLLFQRVSLDDPENEPGIWILDVDSGEATNLAASGMQPAWIAEANVK
jgi:TolB protein